mmetsp:Transcript_66977/g.193545  ORF Transcript_66977/g.193545 Transcript_66977/m.193545 type:complete len:242 (+) Transcript_66977:58-783(+)|eukprot:CAMPEP_0176081624 /NCGR_PEP_ID=MMETSP0120_2-20121206/40829_1 /TAXON_ID=160619 /ORGANISM="Kryptoperidinium foliaceum, Strain CCMP 1326" /LENGTH=241 /DNA_ID=CAMNT_0017415391 /DNA_START=53 /DNA_END=778 /DNA_ORIENTATION=+
MAFNSLLAHVASLVTSEGEVDDSIPCKSDVLTLRDCVKGASKEKCKGLQLDLMQCMAKYNVEATEKVRLQIGIANYNEYVKELEEKHGKEKAAAIIAEPMEKLKTVEAAQMMYRLEKNQHPKGAPKTTEDLANWTQADQSRLAMGEKAYWDAVRVFNAEFGPQKADQLFGIRKEADAVAAAIERIAPGTNAKEVSAKTLGKFNELMEPVRQKAPEASSVEELANAFKKVYPSKSSFDSKLA